MKVWIYGIGLALLPISYVSLNYFTGQPIELPVLGLMALIVLPIIIFRKKIGAVENQFNAMSDQEKMRAIGKAATEAARKASGSD
jgi:hypothetical protein